MKYFNVFSNILFTKGATRILISDLQRNVSELMPLELYEIVEELKSNSIDEILDLYDNESKIIVEEYIDFLKEKEYGFITENSIDKNFPKYSHKFQDHSAISNIIVELDTILVLKKIKNSIENLCIKHLIILTRINLTYQDLKNIDDVFKDSVLMGIQIYSPFYEEVDKNFITNLNTETNRISELVFFDCKKPPFKVEDEYRFTINFTGENIEMKSCGKVDLKYFNTNLPKVLEALNHNSCLHKKIAIDKDGNIRNCPSMPQSFGNIKDTTLEEALHHKDLKKYWNLTKDSIEVCKDCEFRYICTDCRAYTERTSINAKGLDTSRPLKCGYDPYTGEWEEWSTNPLKQNTINFYGMQELIKK